MCLPLSIILDKRSLIDSELANRKKWNNENSGYRSMSIPFKVTVPGSFQSYKSCILVTCSPRIHPALPNPACEGWRDLKKRQAKHANIPLTSVFVCIRPRATSRMSSLACSSWFFTTSPWDSPHPTVDETSWKPFLWSCRDSMRSPPLANSVTTLAFLFFMSGVFFSRSTEKMCICLFLHLIK